MSKPWKISLLKLEMPSSKSNRLKIRTEKGNDIVPLSPTLIDTLPLDEAIKQQWKEKRDRLLDQKNNKTPVDKRLRDYQNQGVNFFMYLKNRGNFDQQRLGKTPTVLTTMRLSNENNALILVPKITIIDWEREYKTWHGGNAIAVLAERYNKDERAEIYKNFEGSIIMNKELFHIDFDLINKRKIDTMVVDEVHHLYTYTSNKGRKVIEEVNGAKVITMIPSVNQNIIKMSRKVNSRYGLTGTLAFKQPEKLYGVLAFLHPDIFTSYWGFIEYYFDVEMVQVARNKEVRKIVGLKSKQHEKELLEFIETFSIQRKRKDHMEWLTEADHNYVWLEMNEKLKEEYDKLHNYYELSNEEIFVANDLSRMIREEQLLNDPRLLEINIASPKTEWFRQFLIDYPEDSILIISPYTGYLRLLHSETKGSMIIDGSTSVKNREKYKQRFNTQPKQILFANIDTIMEGISLYGADSLIVMNRDWVPGKNSQVFDRILATTPEIADQMGAQNIYIVQMEAHIDQYKHEVLEIRQDLNESINNYPKWIQRKRGEKE